MRAQAFQKRIQIPPAAKAAIVVVCGVLALATYRVGSLGWRIVPIVLAAACGAMTAFAAARDRGNGSIRSSLWTLVGVVGASGGSFALVRFLEQAVWPQGSEVLVIAEVVWLMIHAPCLVLLDESGGIDAWLTVAQWSVIALIVAGCGRRHYRSKGFAVVIIVTVGVAVSSALALLGYKVEGP